MSRISCCLTIGVLLVSICVSCPSVYAAQKRPWMEARSWLYKLQHPSIETLAKTDYDLFVIDYSRDGSTTGAFRRDEIEKLKWAGGRRRLVVAYVSIGEAEPYRFYWRPWWKPGKPTWLDRPNPDWPDNFRVKYWNSKWQAILFGSKDSYIDRVMDAGFDGVYLDIVDGFVRYQKKRRTARKEMVDLVLKIADYCRNTKGDVDFGIIPQNAVELIEEDASYVKIITGIGKEETYFCATNEATEDEDRTWEEELLGDFAKKGKLVLCVDYVDEPKGIALTKRRCKQHGFLSLCTSVDLDIDPAQ